MPDCITKSLAKEGVTGFWAGLPTYYFRVGPHAVIVLLTSEVYKKLLGVGVKKWAGYLKGKVFMKYNIITKLSVLHL